MLSETDPTLSPLHASWQVTAVHVLLGTFGELPTRNREMNVVTFFWELLGGLPIKNREMKAAHVLLGTLGGLPTMEAGDHDLLGKLIVELGNDDTLRLLVVNRYSGTLVISPNFQADKYGAPEAAVPETRAIPPGV
jgi:hypothetical protein